MATLLDLPIELLQHIAGYLNYQSLRNLSLGNRELRRSCMNTFVLYGIARYGVENNTAANQHLANIYSPPQRTMLGPQQLEWPQGDKYLQSVDQPTIQRTAASLGSCLENILSQHQDWTFIPGGEVNGNRRYDFCGWLPHLIALQHPILLALEPGQLLRWKRLEIRSRGIQGMEPPWARQRVTRPMSSHNLANAADFNIASFGLAYLTLQRLETTTETLEVIQQLHGVLFPHNTNQAVLTRARVHDMMNWLLAWAQRYGMSAGGFSANDAFSLLLPLIVGIATRYMTRPPDDIPKPSKMRLYDLMNVPSLHDINSAYSFYTWHLDKATQPAFLSDRWYGYGSVYRRWGTVVKFRAPMRAITIYASAPERRIAEANNCTALIDERSNGIDSLGPFTLQGEIFRDGSVHITKQYIQTGMTLQLRGQITPLGIVGIWDRGYYPADYFWIWKDEWR